MSAPHHLRGHPNIRKRLLVHTGAFNLGLLMRTLIGVGTPRGLQGRMAAVWGVGALIQRGGRAVAGMLTIATAGGS